MNRLPVILFVIIFLLSGCQIPVETGQLTEIPSSQSMENDTFVEEPVSRFEKSELQLEQEKNKPDQIEGYEEQRQKLIKYLLQEKNAITDNYLGIFSCDEDSYLWLDSVFVWGEATDGEALCLLYQIGTTESRGGLLPWVLMMDTGETVSFAYAQSGPRLKNFQLGDVNGDGIEEILVHVDSGGNGGAGYFYSMIFSWESGNLTEIYNSTHKSSKISTNFALGYEDGFTYHIENYQTGMDIKLASSDTHIRFDETGKLRKVLETEQLTCSENFLDFRFADMDSDGVYEIIAAEYEVLCWQLESCLLLSALRYDKERDVFCEVKSDVWSTANGWETVDEYFNIWYK